MTSFKSATDLPEELREIFHLAKTEYDLHGVFFLEESYILDIQKRLSPYPNILDELILAASSLKADEENAFYALFVYRVMLNRNLLKKHISLFEFDDEKHPYLVFLLLIPAIENTYNELCSRNIPKDIIKNVLRHYEDCVFAYEERFGRRGLNKRYFNWLQRYVDCKILNIDRLGFELTTVTDPVYLLKNNVTGEYLLLYGDGEMKSDGMRVGTPPDENNCAFVAEFSETSTEYKGHRVLSDGKCSSVQEVFNKSEYTLLVSPADTCLSVHIPSKSKGPFTKEICMENYKRALSVYKEYYPELNIKAIRCRSWMMSQELKDILPENSNILKFQENYHIYPIESDGQGVLDFVFKLTSDNYDDMPEDTSLQRAIKKMYLDGKYVYEYGGIFSPEEL